MSKMSQIHLDLCEQAYRLGFESLEEAEANGYHIAYDSTGWKLKLDMAKAYEQARKDWEKERDEVLHGLNSLISNGGHFDYDIIKHAIEFIEKGEV